MMLIIKGFLIGLGKIIPGVSGAMLAINFNLYEDILSALTNFFSDWRRNTSFLLRVGIGILLAIIIGSKIILYLFMNYQFLTISFFIGLMLGGSYDFSKKITYHFKHVIIIGLIIIAFLYLSLCGVNINNTLSYGYGMYFLSGFIEMFASIVPGISGTSLLMILGIYDEVLKMITNIYNFNYIFNNIYLYLSYGIGMVISCIVNCYLIIYLIKKYQNISYVIILGLSLASISYLIIMTFKLEFTLFELFIGLGLFILGIFLNKMMSNNC